MAKHLILQIQQVIKHWASSCLVKASKHKHAYGCTKISYEPLLWNKSSI